MRRWLYLWGPPGLVMGVIFVASSLSDVSPAMGDLSDVGAHALTYCGLSVTLVRALSGAQWRGVTHSKMLGAILLSTAYGLSDELHQLFVPGRVAEVRDLVADAAGATAGVGFVWAWGIVLSARRRAR